MLETFLMVILLPTSIIFNIILIIRGISFVKQNEQLTDIIKDYDVRQDNTLKSFSGFQLSGISDNRDVFLNLL